MLHAKTAVADGLWARVGSTNLNLQSWMGNWELDVAIEDASFAAGGGADVRGRPGQRHRGRPAPGGRASAAFGARGGGPACRSGGAWACAFGRGGPPAVRATSGQAAAGALRIGNTVGAALTARRTLGAAEAPRWSRAAWRCWLAGVLAAWWPALLAYPAGRPWPLWLGLSLLGAAWRTRAGSD